MHLKPTVVWALVLIGSFCLGFVAMRFVLSSTSNPIQSENAPQAPQ